jgi:ribonuclease P protein component
MLKKRYRLNKNKDFDRVFQQGASAYAAFLGLKVAANNLPESRFAILVSKKIDKKAVARNKLKRQIRNILRADYVQKIKGYDVVIVCLPPIAGKDFNEIKEELGFAFRKLKLV